MEVGLALLPSAAVLVAVLAFRATGLTSAVTAALAALLLWVAQIYRPLQTVQGLHALTDAGVLAALVAAMILPGMLFVEATRGRKSPQAIGALVTAIGLPKPQAAILIATGIGVVVESLTGMGVSLLVTIPLLVTLFDKRAAIGIALVGMSLMPWGALSISAHVAAKLAAVPVESLQGWIAAVSGPVAFFLPLLCLLFTGQRRTVDVLVALLAGTVLTLAIVAASRMVGVEVAGVGGGLAVIACMCLISRNRAGLGAALSARGLVPYFVLLAAVVLQKAAAGPLARAGIAPALATDRVSFSLLTSPGVALLAATLITAPGDLGWPLFERVLRRAWRPVVAIAFFMLSARLMVECGAIEVLARTLGGLNRTAAAMAVALLGAVGGFVTGSGVTGNALFVPSAAATGEVFGAMPLFVALQNATGGHIGMAALPVGAILLAALPRRESGDEAVVMRLGLSLAAWHVAVATCAALVLLVALA